MTETFVDRLINQQELFNEKMQKYIPLVQDLKTAPSPEDTKIIIDTIKNLALHECDIKFLDYIREYLISEGIKQSGKIKMRFYSASAGITNDFKECGYNFDNLPAKIETTNNISENEIINEDFPKFKIDSNSVEAVISGHIYKIWNENDISEIKKIGDNEYQIDIKVNYKQNELVDYSRDIELKFRFEYDKITFFNDRNDNGNFDKNEYGRLFEVKTDEVTKIINQPNGNKIILKDGLSYNISLDKKHISTPGVDNIKFTIKF